MLLEVVDIVPGRVWHARREGEVVARAETVRRPDGRTFLSYDAWSDDDARQLLARVLDDTDRRGAGSGGGAGANGGGVELATRVDAADRAQLALLGGCGFVVARRETEYDVPVEAALHALAGAALPAGVTSLGADAFGVARLCGLDDELRSEVPGTGGWVNDLDEFVALTFDERWFDPALYRVAVDGAGGGVGLVRTFRTTRSRAPRLGLVAVRGPWRRQGVASALLREVLATLHGRSIELALAEADDADPAAGALLRRVGARPTGAALELVRPARRDGRGRAADEPGGSGLGAAGLGAAGLGAAGLGTAARGSVRSPA